MRLIGDVETRQQAERISAYLLTREISTHCEANGDRWQVWVKDEDQIERARQLLEEFKGQPNDPRYREAVDVAQKIAREREKKLQAAKGNYVQMTGDRWNAPITKVAPFTVALVVLSVIVALFLTGLGNDTDGAAMRALTFCSLSAEQAEPIVLNAPPSRPVQVIEGVSWDNRLRFASILRGEIWRLVTPIFIHHGIFHLLFNMYMLVYFARQIEYRYSSAWLAALVVLIAVPSNAAECLAPMALDGAPIVNLGTHWMILLGGMSGVIYGLFGYVWMKVTFDPRAGMYLSVSTVVILLIWLVVCMLPAFPINIGNWAHGIGLATGMAIGYLPKLLSDLGVSRSGRS
jgi:GlpG protein